MKRYNHQIAASLQSRLAKRGREIAKLENVVQTYKEAIKAYEFHHEDRDFSRSVWKMVHERRDVIKPLAHDQKLDREALAAVHELMRMGIY